MTLDEAIKQLKDNRALCINSETEPFAIAYDLAIKVLEQQSSDDDCPLVEIEERKVGKWIDYWGDKTEPDGETWWSGCKCSVCGIFIKSYYKYCPNCGAEMVGAEND